MSTGHSPTDSELAAGTSDAIRHLVTLSRIHYEQLSTAERLVADTIQATPDAIVRFPLKQLAVSIGVSEATVVRFCQTLGYRGLRELKRDFTLRAASRSDVPGATAIARGDSLEAVISKVIRSDAQALTDTLAVLDHAAVATAVELLSAATKIECYAVGSSVPVAIDAYYRFLRIGLPVSVVTDPHMQATAAAHLPKGSVAFAVSHTGRSFETHATFRHAGNAGATRILLTSFSGTPIGALSDIELVVASPESGLRPESVASRIAHLAIVDALSVALALDSPKRSREALLRDDEIIAEREVDR